jgi:hypothetical protein
MPAARAFAPPKDGGDGSMDRIVRAVHFKMGVLSGGTPCTAYTVTVWNPRYSQDPPFYQNSLLPPRNSEACRRSNTAPIVCLCENCGGLPPS